MHKNIPSSLDRDYVIDFTKGFLVITMVAYHTLNYFLHGYHTAYAYLGYVTQAFIFYSGFMCGTVYFSKMQIDRKAAYRRLFIRGIKLIFLFSILNVLIHATISKNINGQDMSLQVIIDHIPLIFTIGYQSAVEFPILLPIGYTLLAAVPIMILNKLKYYLLIFLIIAFALLTILDIMPYFNIRCLMTGIGGILSGLIYNEQKDNLSSSFFIYAGISFLLIFIVLIIPFAFDPRKYFVIYYFYINVIIYNLRTLGSYLNPSRILTKQIIKFGQYSLFLYLAQIFILQIIRGIFNFRIESITIDHLIIFAAVNLFFIALCYLIDYLRWKILIIDKAYRSIFA